MTNETGFIQVVGDNARMKVLEYLISGKSTYHSVLAVTNGIKLSHQTVRNVLKSLAVQGMAIETHKGRVKLYSINQEHMFSKMFISMYDATMVEAASTMPKVEVNVQ